MSAVRVDKILVVALTETSPTTRIADKPPLKLTCIALNEAKAKALL
jgi:hypothetical protein